MVMPMLRYSQVAQNGNYDKRNIRVFQIPMHFQSDKRAKAATGMGLTSL